MMADRATRKRLYTAWNNMRQRCNNPACPTYPWYGGRGIAVCPEWEHSFHNFAKWAEKNGYREDLTLERNDTNGHYCPDNCRWATRKEQANNRRSTRFVTMDGRTQSLKQWSEELGLIYTTIWRRVQKGWPVKRALTEPAKKNRRERT